MEELDDSPVSITLIQPTAVDTPFPQNARNYTDREPKLPTPTIDPEDVAEAILEAAVEGGRDVKVGAMAKLNTAAFKVAPGAADKLSAVQAKRQHYDESPRQPEGTLYQPSHSGQVHGSGGVAPH